MVTYDITERQEKLCFLLCDYKEFYNCDYIVIEKQPPKARQGFVEKGIQEYFDCVKNEPDSSVQDILKVLPMLKFQYFCGQKLDTYFSRKESAMLVVQRMIENNILSGVDESIFKKKCDDICDAILTAIYFIRQQKNWNWEEFKNLKDEHENLIQKCNMLMMENSQLKRLNHRTLIPRSRLEYLLRINT